MSPQRRAALMSVGAAAALVLLKLTVGLAANSLGLVSEAVHSGTDLVAALLTFFALGVAGRPADVSHQYGHGKAEHLAALAEASFLSVASVLIGVRAIERLTADTKPTVHVTWYVLLTVLVVIVVDASRASVSWRISRRTGSAALSSNALHFASDLAGSVAVLVGLLLARAGHPGGDALAALFVAVLVLLAAARLIRVNVDVLMDRAPARAEATARAAIVALGPEVELRRLRMRHAGGRQFADVVIGVAPSAAVGQGHAAADAVEDAVERALPGADVVVHVEPGSENDLRERVHAAAAAVPAVREIHNVSLVEIDGRTELSLHVKLPGGMTLAEAHDTAEHLEAAIRRVVPRLDAVQTHLEPLTEVSEGEEVVGDAPAVERIVREATGAPPRELRFLQTDAGLVAFLTLGLDAGSSLDAAHDEASEIEARIRAEAPEIADVVVHTEPAAERPVRQGRTSGGGLGEPGGSPGSDRAV
jgi:cation diffusion facilitator family transporter